MIINRKYPDRFIKYFILDLDLENDLFSCEVIL